MGSPKLTVTSDGRITSVAYTSETKLPPMILVGINDAMADVPAEATWLSKTDYKFEHVVEPDEMKSADFIEQVLRWIAARLDAGGATMNADISGPIHGFLREAWKSQEPIILDWAEDPNGLEEQWAQLYSELFSGINYDGTGVGYKMGEGDDKLWDEYIFSRLQTEYLEHATVRKTRTEGGKPKIVNVGRSIQSWEDPRQRFIDEAEDGARTWKVNEDPASPMCCACQYLATFGLVTRGFRIEYAKKELQYMRGVVGLSAAPADGFSLFTAPGAWFWRDDKPVTNVAAMSKESPPLATGSSYTFHTYHQLANTSVTVKVAQVPGAPSAAKLRLDIETATSKRKDKLKEVVKTIEANEQTKAASANASTSTVNVSWTGQPGGSHIMQVLRVHKDKTRVQLFDANGGSQSKSAMDAEKDGEGRPLGRGLALEPGLGTNMDSRAYSTIYSLSAAPNGVGIPKPAPDLAGQIELMKKARPIGLARLVLTERRPLNELAPEHVLFVSKLLRTYGDADHQNYTITRYLWSLRNTPGFSSVQPWWFIFMPLGVLARAMWAVGARTMRLSDFMGKHALSAPKESSWFRFASDGGLSVDVNYSEAQILTNIADPSFPGRSKIVRRLKSEPVMPNGARLVAEGMTRVPTAFTQPLPGLPGPRNVVLPVFEKKDGGGIEHKGQTILAWDSVYVRADIQGAERLRTLTGPLLDYFRDG
ncbi:hypothetical protein [Polyangium aurulentum]|uniref:hypothetical protein n=1 Tax=Polyangium aurulentum TaxID=2567896 RepID=UPI0010AE577E|nr:hypothetical protein [Polyangium aurulentum]UQA57866.1 hypothetical protein E8A73_042420 [Polyangium aurulentum]